MFYYPKLGAGMLWEKFEEEIKSKNINVIKNAEVINIDDADELITLEYLSDGDIKKVSCEHVLFSNPLLDFINFYKDELPNDVIDAASKLEYRNHISVHITIDKKLFDDNWIYIHSPELKMARIADFTNFSKDMSIEGNYPLTLEYFCFEDDEIWNSDKNDIIDFAISELKQIFKEEFQVVHTDITKNPKAYPVIRTGYEENLNILREWLSKKKNLTAIGRSGMFKYNNQDHAMATGLYAVRNLLGKGNFDPWEVNVDGEYHEEIRTA